MSVLTAQTVFEPPNDNWKKTLPIWVMEVLDSEPLIFFGWRNHFLHVHVFEDYAELWLDENFTKGWFPFRSFLIDREDADKIYRARRK